MRFLALALALLMPMQVQAECAGQNLITALPQAQRASLQAEAMAVPFASGNLWHATKGARLITLIGTFHLNDPRHEGIMAAFAGDLAAARTLLVEAGPTEVAAIKADLAANPARLIHPGATLPESLSPADWAKLATALTARGIPPFVVARLQPWYVATLLALPACLFKVEAAASGLDQRLITAATAQGLPIMALEPFDTLFTLFEGLSHADQIDLLVETLATTGAVEDDMARTIADSYFAGESRLFWAFSRQQLLDLAGADPARIARGFDLIEDRLMTRRNQAWIAVIEAQAAKGPLVVAFGALHLSGRAGVLNLLAQNGWEISPW